MLCIAAVALRLLQNPSQVGRKPAEGREEEQKLHAGAKAKSPKVDPRVVKFISERHFSELIAIMVDCRKAGTLV